MTEFSAQAQNAECVRHACSGTCCPSDLTAEYAEIRDKDSTNSFWTEFPQGNKGQSEKLWTYLPLTDSLTQWT